MAVLGVCVGYGGGGGRKRERASKSRVESWLVGVVRRMVLVKEGSQLNTDLG